MRRHNAKSPKPDPKPDLDPQHHQKMDNNNNNNKPLSIKSFQFRQTPNFKSNSFSKTLKNQPKSNFLSISLFTLAFTLTLYSLYLLSRQKSSRNFAIIIDGGSTGSRIHVFEFKSEGGVPKFDFESKGKGHFSMKVNPGLSSFGDGDADRAGESLMELLDFGKGIVPKELWGSTEVRLMATAGMRLLDLDVQGRILESCRSVLRSSGFMFRDDWASVITGSDEGLYAWIVANYALGTLGGDPDLTTGIIELGGASAQVTFVSRETVPPEFSRSLKYGNVTYNLYSNSLLHFGQNVAFDSLKGLLGSSGSKLVSDSIGKELNVDPCTPKGYGQTLNLSPNSLASTYSSNFHATGNFSECRAAALKLLHRGKDRCAYKHCSLGATFMPELHGNRFLATENFFYTSQFFGLGRKAVLSDIMKAGQQFCEEEWSNIRKKYKSLEEEDLVQYCFSSAYIVALLHDSLGIALDDPRIGYTNQVEKIPLDWALGAFILQTTDTLNIANHGSIASLIGDNLPNHFLILGVAILLMFGGCYISQWRKPYLKTIYDLEKGRYIVTRINR